ncbi:aminoglycoside phosphotransferase family protein [Puniceibacterium sp. IMCC21224]|uniref:aminoglycoside phosphotransferase family protein n=1 Tax=Puniceibacterium sp. IMCC21224 TaxID=1618204 RepID=UPI00064DED07|nr:phosphotransferase [Puniceibacterium sp. IMCC21224]
MIQDFLTIVGWQDAQQFPLAGDASSRRYIRLVRGSTRAILMHDPEGDVTLFAQLARHLSGLNLSAPQVYAENAQQGLLLIEDLGDALFARLCEQHPSDETPLYLAATEALIALHRYPPPRTLPIADPSRLAQMTDLAFLHYLPRATGHSDTGAQQACIAAFHSALNRYAPDTDVMILRDFHAENLIWLPDRSATARTGLLDFQDALAGHRAYDLASLLTDARRDVSPDTAEAAIRHYIAATGIAEEPFRAAIAVLGAQRNLRILGVFARLAASRGKPHYIDLIPRVWGHLMADLKHPALRDIAPLIVDCLPEPTAPIVERLKTPCPTQ